MRFYVKNGSEQIWMKFGTHDMDFDKWHGLAETEEEVTIRSRCWLIAKDSQVPGLQKHVEVLEMWAVKIHRY